ncbi:DUF2063 domain-containing protein [Rhizobium sp. G21]|uniref:HvfC/BufC N-terminal domain-containing protein n=1 Tax=Rhizobium sp. G21 TaxID=2758439 RepID=UPI00160278E2|nr:DNA-binding domain-containing protein [Rhizobium sp. G21]MBB1248325.1 putative DNA-binding domain-containing protein [Rhizobium sp. G21]
MQIHDHFAAALLTPGETPPEGLKAWSGPVGRRFRVYRDNVAIGLRGALASRFPVIEKLVGDAFFTAMAEVFVSAHPPRSPLLLNYGDDLPEFLAGFEPVAELPYLADVARLEIARSHAYHAADADPLDPQALAALPPGRLAEIRFRAHPSLAVIASAHPVGTIWAMNSGEAEPGPITDWRAEDVLVCRPEMLVETRVLPPGGALFLNALAEGASLGSAYATTAATTADFDITRHLTGLIQAGCFIALEPLEPQP